MVAVLAGVGAEKSNKSATGAGAATTGAGVATCTGCRTVFLDEFAAIRAAAAEEVGAALRRLAAGWGCDSSAMPSLGSISP